MSAVTPYKISPEKLAALLAVARKKREDETKPELAHSTSTLDNESLNQQSISQSTSNLQYNKEQLAFMNLASSGASSVLIGAAGTGKTTCMKGVIESLIQSSKAGLLFSDGHKYLPKEDGAPGIIAVSFTRRAVANLRKAMPADMKGNTLTIHAALEYEPVYYTVIDEATGEERNTMKFEPTRNSVRPLSSSIRVCIIDESSMVSVELFKELQSALPAHTQYIFLGDIQQLPPVFGSAILGYKMLELTTIELTQVYRQALESPIIRLAHRILSGKGIPASEYPNWKVPDKLTIHPWKKKLHSDVALFTAAKFFTTALEAGAYNIDEDMILLPFNKAFGTIELNKHIANFIAKKEQKLVYEIIAGFNKSYLSIGDRILVDKEDAIVNKITPNKSYIGARAQTESVTLDYWGYDSGRGGESKEHHIEDGDIDFLLEQVAKSSGEDSEERVRQASHTVTVELLESGNIIDISTASELNALLLSYALTVHKSQGSEWRKVFLVFHQSHATMLQRELLYTAVTRAREELYVICEPETFTNGIRSQRIKGNTLAEKAEYFKGKTP